MAMGNRKIGLGVMGWADMLILLGIPYASHEATELADRLMRFIQDRTRETSEELAQSRLHSPTGRQAILPAASHCVMPPEPALRPREPFPS